MKMALISYEAMATPDAAPEPAEIVWNILSTSSKIRSCAKVMAKMKGLTLNVNYLPSPMKCSDPIFEANNEAPT